MVLPLALHVLLASVVAQATAATPSAGAGAPESLSAPAAAPSAPTPVTVPPPGGPDPAAQDAQRPAAGTPPVAKPVPQEVVEKIGQGDRHFLERDYRSALFAYQDAVYLAPDHAPARVRLGKAYLALRYPERAAEQAKRALELDPANLEATRLLEEARNPKPRSVVPREAPRPAVAEQPPASPPAPAAQPQPLVFRFTPEPEPEPRHPAVASPQPAAPPDESPAPARQEAPARVEGQRTAAVVSGPPASPAQTAADRYRAGVALLGNREFEKAVAELTEAISADPRLAVAYAARASARFGLGRYREAADDYSAALGLDPGLATPLYGLAECYRVLGDPGKAADMYARYAESQAPDVREDLRAIAGKRAKELR